MTPQPVYPCARLTARMLLVVSLSLGAVRAQSMAPSMGQQLPVVRRGDPDAIRLTPGDRGPRPVFFPPFPPPIDRPVQRGVVFTPGGMTAPAELAHFVNEPFYPQLASRLYLHSLNDKLRPQVDAYLATKRSLQAELQAELDRTQAYAPADRLAALEKHARSQAPKLAALEQSGEQLRRDLSATGTSWNDLREWHLSDREERGFSPVEIAVVMRAYAYYDNDLLPGQRRLLREIAIEMLNAADSADHAAAAQPYVFFPPEPARILFPDDLPAELDAKVAHFQTRKSQLKKELYDAVTASDGISFNFLRRPLRTLAAKQAAGLAELDTLAEEIRRGLAAVPAKPRVEDRSPLPPRLAARLVALLRSRATYQREANAKVDEIVTVASDLAIRYRFDEDGFRFAVLPPRAARIGPTPEATKRVEAVRMQLTAVADEYQRHAAEFTAERDSIREDTGKFLGTTDVTKIDAALIVANRLAAAAENEPAARIYRLAVFEPGLSPAQRRLLFDSAIEQLELPLPSGEPQPVFRANRW